MTGPLSQKKKLLDRVRDAARLKHYSLRTEDSYVAWIRRFILFHEKRHPAGMGLPEVRRFLTHLAVREKVAAATQNQALNALVFFYRDVLTGILRVPSIRARQRAARLPTVLSHEEVVPSSLICRAITS